ncbi:hypothetical protein V6N13_009283 [Hibiscus sabdariffa]
MRADAVSQMYDEGVQLAQQPSGQHGLTAQQEPLRKSSRRTQESVKLRDYMLMRSCLLVLHPNCCPASASASAKVVRFI